MSASYYLSHSMSRPILKLNAVMKTAESGNFSTFYQEEREDEIGLLGKSFNRLMMRIRELMSVTERQERQKKRSRIKGAAGADQPSFSLQHAGYNQLDGEEERSGRGQRSRAGFIQAVPHLLEQRERYHSAV